MTNAAAGLFATDLIARRYLEGDKRILVLLLLLLTPFYQFHGQRFASSQTLLSTWPIATYCFLRAFETRGLVWSAAAGAAAALAMLGKYYSIFLIAGFLAAVLAHPGRWAYLRSASPWISAAVGGVVLAPHVQWLFATEFTPFSYATALHAGASLGEVLWKPSPMWACWSRSMGSPCVPIEPPCGRRCGRRTRMGGCWSSFWPCRSSCLPWRRRSSVRC
jgi:hypothetical protein